MNHGLHIKCILMSLIYERVMFLQSSSTDVCSSINK